MYFFFLPFFSDSFLNICLQVQNAIDYLKMIGALDENENLTALGMGRFELII